MLLKITRMLYTKNRGVLTRPTVPGIAAACGLASVAAGDAC